MTDAGSRTRMTAAQKANLINYMWEHRDFANGRFSPTVTNIDIREQWSQLGAQLNAISRCHKTAREWQNVSTITFITSWVVVRFKFCSIHEVARLM